MEGFDTAGSFGLKVLNGHDPDSRRVTREIAFRPGRTPSEYIDPSRVRSSWDVSVGSAGVAL